MSSFIWGSKGPRIQKRLLQRHQSQGILGLPSLLYYQWAANIQKIIYWLHALKPSWCEIENESYILTSLPVFGLLRSNSSVLILLNLSSAFDTVNHQILLSTLAELGITDSALTWFTSYLTNRTFQVTWNGSLSKPCFMETGVPQGSVLGLLLFPLYTRSLGSAITLHGFSYHCYADDTHLFFSFHPSSSNTHFAKHILECLPDISTWTAAHYLNLSKTELHFIPGKDCPRMDSHC